MFKYHPVAPRSQAQRDGIMAENAVDARWAVSVIRADHWDQGELFLDAPGEANLPIEPSKDTVLASKRVRDLFKGPGAPPYRMNDNRTGVSLWYVPQGSEEEATVLSIAMRGRNAESPAAILRVQNWGLLQSFHQAMAEIPPGATPGALRAGFHSAMEHEAWSSILRVGLRPDLSGPSSDKYGIGSYFSRTTRYCVRSIAPLFSHAEGSHLFVGLFLCHAGQTLARGEEPARYNPFLPEGAGSFGERASREDDMPDIFCIQDWRRMYPAYMLVFRI